MQLRPLIWRCCVLSASSFSEDAAHVGDEQGNSTIPSGLYLLQVMEIGRVPGPLLNRILIPLVF